MQNNLDYGEIIYKTKDIEIIIAKNRETQEEFCIKRYKSISSIVSQALENELSFLYSLKHPNILKIFSHSFCPDGSVELILEYCSKRDLCDEINRRVKQNQPWSEQKILKIMEELINAFAYLQKQKIAHRDIKPDNILVSSDGTCKIGDLGNSKRIISQPSKTIVGTAYYMSPELRQTQNYGSSTYNHLIENSVFKSDVWSLGLTFLVLVSLKSVEDFSNLNSIEITQTRRLSEIKNPYQKRILELMLIYDGSNRPDFIQLYENTINLFQQSKTCRLCSQYDENIYWCYNCYTPYHPNCLSKESYICICSFNSQDADLHCISCEKLISIQTIKQCNHILCEDCSYMQLCSSCLEIPILSPSSFDLPQMIFSHCRECFTPLASPSDWQAQKCPQCSKTICPICKDQTHSLSCSEKSSKYKILCRCLMLRTKDPGSLYLQCPICKFICIVCYRSMTTSHLSCLQLFTQKFN